MASTLAQSSVSVDGPDGTSGDRLSIIVRNNQAKVLDRSGTTLVERGSVAAVAQVRGTARPTWLVSFEDGTSWTVTKAKRGCGCGS